MTLAGFKPTISADKQPQTYTTGTDIVLNTLYKMINIIKMSYSIGIDTRINLLECLIQHLLSLYSAGNIQV